MIIFKTIILFNNIYI